MADTHCPLCYCMLETRRVAPCYDCGHDPAELEDLARGEHTYDEVGLLGARAVLCDFCQSDFASYDPTYFGRPLGTRLGRDIQLIRRLGNPEPELDKYCPKCKRCLAFLRFVERARAAAAV